MEEEKEEVKEEVKEEEVKEEEEQEPSKEEPTKDDFCCCAWKASGYHFEWMMAGACPLAERGARCLPASDPKAASCGEDAKPMETKPSTAVPSKPATATTLRPSFKK